MKTETEIKEQEWTKSISSASSSRSSSITSDSSDGHFDIRHFPLPKPALSASEAQKQKDSHQIYNSSVSSYTGSSWSHLVDLPGYDPNRIPSSVFSSKPGNSTEWSIASNESLFSIHDGNFNFSTKEEHGLARLSEIPRFEEINPVHLPPPLPPVNKPKESKKETITETSDSETDDSDEEAEMIELESDDEHEEEEEDEEEEDEEEEEEEEEEDEEEEDMTEAEVLKEIETEKTKENKKVEVVKESRTEDASSVVSHSPSISCRSDTSTNSIGSFAFPVLQKEDEVIKTPSMEIKGNIALKRTPEYYLPQSPMRPPQSQAQPYSETSMLTELQPQSQPQRKASKNFESQTQSPKASKSGWFSCFKCHAKCGLFK